MALIVGAAIIAITIVLTNGTIAADNAIYDFTFRLRHETPSPQIVIVGIDDASMKAKGEWPWPREIVGDLLQRLARDKPVSITFNFLIRNPGTTTGDAEIIKGMRMAHVYMPEAIEESSRGHQGYMTTPLDNFFKAAKGVGRADPTPDADGIVRRAPLLTKFKDQTVSHMMLLASESLTSVSNNSRIGHFSSMFDDNQVDSILIPYAGNYTQVSAIDILNGKIRAGYFKDKFVILGMTSSKEPDLYPTPISNNPGMSNVEIDANVLNAIIGHRLHRPLSPTLRAIAAVAAVWAFCAAILALEPSVVFTIGVAGAFGVLASSLILLIAFGIWLPPTPVLLTAAVVQGLWSSRRLQAASNYLARELAELQTRESGAIIVEQAPIPKTRLYLGDSVSRQMMLIGETRERLRQLREFVNGVLANFQDPVFVVTRRGRILLHNNAAASLAEKLGVSAEVSAQIQPLLDELQNAAGEGGGSLWPPPEAGEDTPRGLGPGGRILEARYMPTGVEDGVVRGWTIQLIDVTRLVSATRQREEALKLFTHDMRSPQSAILAALAHQDFQDIPKSLRESIEKNAKRTISLADGWVRLAQAESAEYQFEDIDLFHALSDAADSQWPNAEAAGVEIVVNYPDEEFVVMADRGMIARALINLIDNAIKASTSGKKVTCGLKEALLHGQPAVALSIADEASGMTKDQRESLFKRFARTVTYGDDGRKRPVRFDSVGLGLAVVHTVVTRHNGQIECDSELGVGTTFTITLPIHEDAAPVDPEEVDDVEAPIIR